MFDLDLKVHKDDRSGFALTRTLREQVRQKFKTLLLTMPGERLMNANLGVGLQTYLFAGHTGDTGIHSSITNRIQDQVAIYMPYVNILDIQFSEAPSQPNSLYIKIYFEVSVLGIEEHFAAFAGDNGNIEASYGDYVHDV